MRVVLNVIWLLFAGFGLFVAYLLAGIICCLLVITIPWGIASFRIANYVLWPFGREVVGRPDAGTASFLGNVIWFVFAGWWLALAHLISGIMLCLTIIGIPMAVVDFKLIPISLAPLGKQIVTIDDPEGI